MPRSSDDYGSISWRHRRFNGRGCHLENILLKLFTSPKGEMEKTAYPNQLEIPMKTRLWASSAMPVFLGQSLTCYVVLPISSFPTRSAKVERLGISGGNYPVLTWMHNDGVSDHLGGKSYMTDGVNQSPPLPLEGSPNGNSLVHIEHPEMDTSPFTKEFNIKTQEDLDKLKEKYYFPPGVQIRIPREDKMILSTRPGELCHRKSTCPCLPKRLERRKLQPRTQSRWRHPNLSRRGLSSRRSNLGMTPMTPRPPRKAKWMIPRAMRPCRHPHPRGLNLTRGEQCGSVTIGTEGGAFHFVRQQSRSRSFDDVECPYGTKDIKWSDSSRRQGKGRSVYHGQIDHQVLPCPGPVMLIFALAFRSLDHHNDYHFQLACADSAELEMVEVVELTGKLAQAKKLTIDVFKSSNNFKDAITDFAATYFS
ncbi:hypothetical protein Acr_15g0001150 [Actinidia rufa]|uniref:Uncharacterized protein n=1 Tax=Actinidia rufa TaxID=165716 RepID=A0A7J0FS16_9ERIC|nr:hypothetical protein Acr_15g0001150 [Actinidia rufa]